MNLFGLGVMALAAAAIRAPRRARLVVDTYEAGAAVPVLTHSFYGSTLEEARAVRAAHARYDAFFAGCEKGRFQGARGGFACRNVTRGPGAW